MVVTAPGRPFTQEPTLPGPNRRKLRTRVSTGHVVMVVSGLLAALLTFSLLRDADPSHRVALVPGAVAAGNPVDPGSVRFTDVDAAPRILASLFEPGDLDELDGMVAAVAIPAGTVLTRALLRPATGAQPLRTMGLAVPRSAAAGGRLVAGDRVDVITVVEGVASYVATDTEVVSAAADAGALTRETIALVLAVDDRTALELAAAAASGDLHVVRATGAPLADSDATSAARP